MNTPVVPLITDPFGAPDSENDSVSAGMSASVAFAVNVIGDNSSPDWFQIVFNIGADGKMVFA